jgi:hypothetical protein
MRGFDCLSRRGTCKDRLGDRVGEHVRVADLRCDLAAVAAHAEVRRRRRVLRDLHLRGDPRRIFARRLTLSGLPTTGRGFYL